MIVENQLYPSADTIASLSADVSDKRIVTLNLLKFAPAPRRPSRMRRTPRAC
jgi:hypothetical protein